MAFKKTQLALMIALAIQQLSNPAFAQIAAPEQADATLPEVKVKSSRELPRTYNAPTATSATKIEAPLRDIPQTVNVVPQQLLRDQGAHSLEAVLKSVPGVGLSNGDGQRDQVTIRGFSAISDQFVDGFRDDALYFRDLSNIEQVEVIKGPASVLYGRGSSGGLINRITKKPGIDKSEISATVGSWNQRRGEFDLARNYSDSGVAFRITGAVERADSYRDQQFLDSEVISPSLLFKLGSNTNLLLQAEHLSDRRITDFGIPSYQGKPVDVPASTYYGAANARDVDYVQSDVTSYGFTFDHRFNEHLSLRNAFRYYDYTSDRNNTLVKTAGGVNEAAQTAMLNHSSFRREDDGYFNQTELTQKLEIAGMEHQILYGMELGKQDKGQALTPAVDYGPVNLFRPVLPVVARTFAGPTSTLSAMKTSSVYLQDMVTLSKQWKALAGVRYDRFEQKTRTTTGAGSKLERTDREWSPRVGLVYQPTTSQSYYASFSKSFQPSAENFPLAANNEDIAPEETTNKEIGAKFDFFGGLASATASLFQLERTNIKQTDPATRQLIPVGTQRTNGLELTFTGDLSNGWQLWSGYSYLDAKVTSSPAVDNFDNTVRNVPVQGKRATLTPKHSANLWITKALGNGARAGAGVNYVDDRFANLGNTVTLPAYTTVDAMVGYKIASLDLQLNINNLFDRKYIVSGHGTVTNLNTPGAPRNVQLTARYSF
ncbi:MAG: TonB-dependent receptor [Burkholderiales bacterium RIFCSPLOWO2_02_FULL_57_36]|nr:MAG: TonB-dependent receptor [Burkholderiales bacterium RIFCSPLOWO2_02_FULL_57_36]